MNFNIVPEISKFFEAKIDKIISKTAYGRWITRLRRRMPEYSASDEMADQRKRLGRMAKTGAIRPDAKKFIVGAHRDVLNRVRDNRKERQASKRGFYALGEAVDRGARAARIVKLDNYARKLGRHTQRLFSRGIGYRTDKSAAPLSTTPLTFPLVKKGVSKNSGAAIALSKYAAGKARKASLIVRKMANKFTGNTKNNAQIKREIDSIPNIDSNKRIARYVLRKRHSD